MNLSTRIEDAGTTYKMHAKRLAKLGIFTVEDLLFHFPMRYENFSLVSPVDVAQSGEVVTVQGSVIATKNIFTKRFKIQQVTIQDNSGLIDCIWFNQQFILKTIHVGDFISVSGKVGEFSRKKSVTVKTYEIIDTPDADTVHTGGLVPVYPSTAGLSPRWIRNRIKELLEHVDIVELIPQEILDEKKLLKIRDALEEIHFPKSVGQAERARNRFAFEELFIAQLGGLLRRQEWQQIQVNNKFEVDAYKKELDKLLKSLPFELTFDQKKTVDHILEDLERDRPMNRLIQGDVGSGKTVIAAITAYIAYLNGFQTVVMAPTEILASQHFKTFETVLSPFNVRVGIKTSSKKLDTKLSNTFDVLVGTHAVLSKNVNYKQVGLVIIDEQQRFGVEQRAQLREKGSSPHFLTMTATPIPRTVSLTLFGDLDVSYIRQMPKGRMRIKTWFVPEKKRKSGYEWVREHLKKQGEHNQMFVVCPLIEESESMTTVKAATIEYKRLKTEVFPEFSLALLHGRLKGKEKDEILKEFRAGIFDIVVATPVVEVGIDIPNATIMLIEGADRFGLAQLYQLRGRVGRSDKQSYCLLFSESKNERTIQRLKLLEKAYSGAELAELDLKLRGPGDVFGTLQHGQKLLKVASFADFELIEEARNYAEKIVKGVHNYPLLQEKAKKSIVSAVSPD